MNHNSSGYAIDPGVSRRAFLRLSAGAAGALVVVKGTAGLGAPTAANGPAAPLARKLKLGIVGCGGRGAWIANLFKQHGGYEMWAVADYFDSVAQRCGEALGVDAKRRFSTLSGYKRVIESGVEAIALETPPCFFPEHTAAAVAAGLHVYMAKPVAVDVPGCLAIQESARKAAAAKKVFLVDYQIPTDPGNIQVVNTVRTGEIGNIIGLHSHYFAGQFPDPPHTASIESRLQGLIWCNDIAIGGGYHANACIHAVEAALWMAGSKAVSAFGISTRGRPDAHGDSHDLFQFVLELENGMSLSHRGKHINNLNNFDVICTAMGTKGFAQIAYGGHVFAKGPENGYSGEVANLYEAGAVRNIDKFHKSVVENKCANDTVPRAIDSALATILGREAGSRRAVVTMKELLRENRSYNLDLRGLKS